MDIDKRDEAVSYTYDNGNRLVSMTSNGKTTKYTYDKAGNLTNDGSTTYTYGQQNRLLSKTGTDGTTTYTYDAAGNLTKETTPDGTIEYTYNAQNRLTLGERSDGQSSEYVYNAMGARVENTQVRKNKNAAYQSGDLIDGSHGTDYRDFLSDQRATWQRTWETEVGTTVQNDYETVTQHYIIDYLSMANRDIMVTEDGSWTQRYVYDQSGTRISAEYTHADGTERGATNTDGEYGENFQSDTAVDEVGKVYFRTSPLGSTLFAIDADGETVSHTIYDPWGKPLTETNPDVNFAGIDNITNYTGYTWDETLGLYYAQNRFDDADAHRFTQQDSMKADTNWYVYCENNPLINVDLFGLRSYVIYDPNRFTDYPGGTYEKQNADAWQSAFGAENKDMLKASSYTEFIIAWDSMENVSSENSNPIDNVVIAEHGNPLGIAFYDYDEKGKVTSQLTVHNIPNLTYKKISNLFLNSCNTGHLNYSTNVASTFAARLGIGRVIAPDGSAVNHYEKGLYSDIRAGNTAAWEDYRDNYHYLNHISSAAIKCYYMDTFSCTTKERNDGQNAGWILYEHGLRVQIADENPITIAALFTAGSTANVSDKAYNNSAAYTIYIKPGENFMTVNGTKVPIDPGNPNVCAEYHPENNGRLMLPARAIIEAMGGTAVWTNNEATFLLDGKDFKVNGTVMTWNGGKVITSDVSPYISEYDRTMVPVRAVSEAFGATVDFRNGFGYVYYRLY